MLFAVAILLLISLTTLSCCNLFSAWSLIIVLILTMLSLIPFLFANIASLIVVIDDVVLASNALMADLFVAILFVFSAILSFANLILSVFSFCFYSILVTLVLRFAISVANVLF